MAKTWTQCALIIVNLNLNQMSKWGQMPRLDSKLETIIKCQTPKISSGNITNKPIY